MKLQLRLDGIDYGKWTGYRCEVPLDRIKVGDEVEWCDGEQANGGVVVDTNFGFVVLIEKIGPHHRFYPNCLGRYVFRRSKDVLLPISTEYYSKDDLEYNIRLEQLRKAKPERAEVAA
jgi:hypothetical protein